MHGQTHPPLPPVALDLVWLQQLVRYTNFPTRPLRQSIGYEHSQEVSTLRSRAAMSMWSPPLAPASGHFGRIEIATDMLVALDTGSPFEDRKSTRLNSSHYCAYRM